MAELQQKNITINEALNNFIVEVQGVFKKYDKTPFIKSGECLDRFLFGIRSLSCADMILSHNATVTNDTIAVCVEKT